MRADRARRWVAHLLLITGVLCVAYVGSETVAAWLYQQKQTAVFDRMRDRRATTSKTGKVRPPLERQGDVVGMLDVPRLGLSTVVTLGDDRNALAAGAGLLADTSRPWLRGNTAIAGHRDGIFRPLSRIRVGDEIVVRTPRGPFRYRVRATKITTPNDLSVLANRRAPSLTLITCYPFWYVGPAPKRFIVSADRISAAKVKRSTVRSKRARR